MIFCKEIDNLPMHFPRNCPTHVLCIHNIIQHILVPILFLRGTAGGEIVVPNLLPVGVWYSPSSVWYSVMKHIRVQYLQFIKLINTSKKLKIMNRYLSFMNIHAKLQPRNFHVGTQNKEFTCQVHLCRIISKHISISKQSRPWSGSSYKSCLIWVCSVCKSIKGGCMR